METTLDLRQVQEQLAAFEERFQDWQFSYQAYQRYLAAFYQRQAQFKERLRRSRERQRSRATMKHELVATLMQGNGQVVAMPTDELLAALDHVRAGSRTQGQSLSSNKGAVYAFLQAIKRAMHPSEALTTCAVIVSESDC